MAVTTWLWTQQLDHACDSGGWSARKKTVGRARTREQTHGSVRNWRQESVRGSGGRGEHEISAARGVRPTAAVGVFDRPRRLVRVLDSFESGARPAMLCKLDGQLWRQESANSIGGRVGTAAVENEMRSRQSWQRCAGGTKVRDTRGVLIAGPENVYAAPRISFVAFILPDENRYVASAAETFLGSWST